jgi:hypothetical protein
MFFLIIAIYSRGNIQYGYIISNNSCLFKANYAIVADLRIYVEFNEKI